MVEADVVLYHPFLRKTAHCPFAACSPVDRSKLRNRSYRFLYIFYQKSCFSMFDQLRHRAPVVGDYRRSGPAAPKNSMSAFKNGATRSSK